MRGSSAGRRGAGRRGTIAALLLLAAWALGAVPAGAQRTAASCNAVPASAVSAIVGYTVPAGMPDVIDLKATKANDGISAVVTSCTYGAETSLSALKKVVSLQLEVTSKPITIAEVENSIKTKVPGSDKIHASAYSGLGVPGIEITETGPDLDAVTITGLAGTHSFGASVFQPTPTAKLAALAKLAAKL